MQTADFAAIKPLTLQMESLPSRMKRCDMNITTSHIHPRGRIVTCSYFFPLISTLFLTTVSSGLFHSDKCRSERRVSVRWLRRAATCPSNSCCTRIACMPFSCMTSSQDNGTRWPRGLRRVTLLMGLGSGAGGEQGESRGVAADRSRNNGST